MTDIDYCRGIGEKKCLTCWKYRRFLSRLTNNASIRHPYNPEKPCKGYEQMEFIGG